MTIRELIDTIKALYAAIVSKDLVAAWPLVGKLLGAFRELIDGPPMVGGSEEDDKDLQESIAALESLHSMGATEAVDPATIGLIITLVKTLVDLWRKRK